MKFFKFKTEIHAILEDHSYGKNNIKNLEYNYAKDMSLSCINIGSVMSVCHLSCVMASYCRAEI